MADNGLGCYTRSERNPHMATLIVPLKLKPGADREAYERFAREVDGPTITAEFLSVSEWHVYRAEQVLGSEEPAPFD